MKIENKTIAAKSDLFSTLKKLTVAAGLAGLATTGLAQSFYTNSTGDFNVAASWNPNGVPGGNATDDNGSNNVVLIQPGDPTWGHGDTLAGQTDGSSGAYLQTGSTNNTGYPNNGNWLRMGIGNGSTGYYVLSNGVVNVAGRTQLGEHGFGYLEIDGGVYNTGYNGNPGIVAGQGDFGLGSGTLVINGGAVTNVNNETWFGQGNSACTGNFFMNGGVFKVNSWFVFGRNGGNGFGTMTAGTLTMTGGGQFLVGGGGIGSLTQSGGTLNIFDQYLVPQSNGGGSGMGTNNLSGNAVLNVHSWFAVGRNSGYGELNISGNAAINRDNASDGGSHFDIGASAPGVVNQTGGTITETTSDVWLGESGSGTWNFNGGTALLKNLVMCVNSSASAQLNLNSGLFQVSRISSSTSASAVSLLNLNGATLQASGNNVAFINGIYQASIGAGGITIDSQGYNITIPQALTDAGGGTLAKIGSGTLTLPAANSYAGTTAVNAGTLATTTASTGGGGYSVANGATLNVQVVGGLNSQLGMSSLSFASSATTLGVDLNNFGNPTLAPINVSGALTVNGTVTINVLDALPQVGQFPLISYTSKSGSSYVLGSLPLGVTATLVDNTANNSIDLNITAVNLPRWDGNAGGNWDIGLTTNWVNIGTGLPTYFGQGNAVTFDDNATGTPNVNLVAAVTPSSVTINNNAITYTISGTGSINGTGGVLKEGTGSATISTANGYTGPTTILNGTLNVSSLANGGTASAIGASSSSPTNLALGGGTLVYTGPTVTINRGYSLQGVNTNSTIDTENNLTLSGKVTAGPGDGFNKIGPAQLAYTTVGSNSLSGANYEVQAGSLRLDGSAGGQTNIIAGHLGLNGVTGVSAVLTNTTLNCGDFYVGNQAGMIGSAEIDNGTTINDNSWFILGDGANAVATVTMNGGTLNIPNGRLFLCSAPGTSATFNMNGGTINKTGDYFAIVNGGWNGAGARTGVVNQVNGIINCQSECWVGDAGGAGNGSLGIYNLSGGTLTLGSWFGVGRDGSTGIFHMTGGTLNKAGAGDMVVGRGGSAGTFTMTAGAINKDAGNPVIIGQGGGVGEFDISGGTLTNSAEYWIGVDNGSIGTNNISGTASVNVHNWVTVGRQGLGVVNMTGGQFNSDTQPFIVGIWGGSTGIWNQASGALNINQDIWIGQGDNNAHGVINLSGGTITNTGWLAIGREGAHGVLNVSGGTMVHTGGGNISIAHNGGASGDVTISGSGTFINAVGETWVGENAAPGTWTMNGGTAILGVVHLAQNADATGVMTLNGGSLTATEISTGNNGATQRELDLNGGAIVAGADNANFIHDLSAANVQTGGVIFNTASHAVSVNQALLGAANDGGVTKNGNGTLYLNGVNTYTNTTSVTAGALGGSGTIAGAVTVASGAQLAPGTSTIGTLTINNALSLASGSSTAVKVSLDGGATNDVVAGLTSVNYAGSLIISNVGTSPLVAGAQFHVFNAAAHSGSFTSVTVLPAGAGTFDPNTGIVTITVGSGGLAFNPVKVSGGNLILTGTGGTANGSYTLLTTTNLLSGWTTNTTGTLDGSGAFSNAVPVSSSQPAQFFRVRTP